MFDKSQNENSVHSGFDSLKLDLLAIYMESVYMHIQNRVFVRQSMEHFCLTLIFCVKCRNITLTTTASSQNTVLVECNLNLTFGFFFLFSRSVFRSKVQL